MKKAFVFSTFLTILSALPAQAFEYKVTTSLWGADKIAVQNLLHKAESMLPATLKDSLSTVEIRFDNVRSSGRGHGTALGYTNYRFRNITLDRSLISEIVKGPEHSAKTVRVHKNMYNEALATILHETTHLYDMANVHPDDEKEWISRCDTKFARDKDDRIRNGSRPFACKYYQNMTTSFSKNPYFLQVAGWMGDRENGFNQRSPDIYEIKDSKEYLATNMEYFLMEPDYKCRRPGMYQILSKHFQHVPFQNVTCEQNLGYVLPNGNYEKAALLSIDPARVYQIHYLFADKGADLVSGWGHSMIRLIICSPKRAVVGPDCLRDVEYHAVLSFRAYVDTPNTNMWSGLTGEYPSRLFILPMNQVIDEYPRGQFRSLKSLPMNLSRKQIQEFITRSVEIHWAYNGRYKFVSNNCATETLNLIQSVLLTPQIMFTEIKTPISLYKVLVKQGLADDRVFSNLKTANEKGFFFESYEARYQKVFDILSESLRMPTKTFKEYIKLRAYDRSRVIHSVNRSQVGYKKMAASLYLLESAAQKQLQQDVLMELQAMITEGKAKGDRQSIKLDDTYMKLADMFAKPSSFLPQYVGYGLPTGVEMKAAETLLLSKAQQARELKKTVVALQDSQLSGDLLNEVKLVKTNLETLQKLLSEK
ncbi:MAG: DUF4105 domain-containing protein [Bdellovibrio sp.]|nr:DUF4105 domain-containing protein [Bdellovibrio sp.]